MPSTEREAVLKAWTDHTKNYKPNGQFHVSLTSNWKPGHGMVRRNKKKPEYFGCTGILVRGFDKIDREHQFHLGVYSLRQLEARERYLTGENSIYKQSKHLQAFKILIDTTKQKISFALGFVITEDGVLRRDSCVNKITCDSKNLSNAYYISLLRILHENGYPDVKSDMDAEDSDNDSDDGTDDDSDDDSDDGISSRLGRLSLAK